MSGFHRSSFNTICVISLGMTNMSQGRIMKEHFNVVIFLAGILWDKSVQRIRFCPVSHNELCAGSVHECGQKIMSWPLACACSFNIHIAKGRAYVLSSFLGEHCLAVAKERIRLVAYMRQALFPKIQKKSCSILPTPIPPPFFLFLLLLLLVCLFVCLFVVFYSVLSLMYFVQCQSQSGICRIRNFDRSSQGKPNAIESRYPAY